jgi:hypothetical protein
MFGFYFLILGCVYSFKYKCVSPLGRLQEQIYFDSRILLGFIIEASHKAGNTVYNCEQYVLEHGSDSCFCHYGIQRSMFNDEMQHFAVFWFFDDSSDLLNLGSIQDMSFDQIDDLKDAFKDSGFQIVNYVGVKRVGANVKMIGAIMTGDSKFITDGRFYLNAKKCHIEVMKELIGYNSITKSGCFIDYKPLGKPNRCTQ